MGRKVLQQVAHTEQYAAFISSTGIKVHQEMWVYLQYMYDIASSSCKILSGLCCSVHFSKYKLKLIFKVTDLVLG